MKARHVPVVFSHALLFTLRLFAPTGPLLWRFLTAVMPMAPGPPAMTRWRASIIAALGAGPGVVPGILPGPVPPPSLPTQGGIV